MRSRRQPFAVFDIDGTVIRWQLFHAVVDALVQGGKIDSNKFTDAKAARMVWKNRVENSSFKDYELALIKIHDEAIRNISYYDYMAAIQEVFDEYKDQTYTYTRDLIKQLKSKDYLLFTISGSQNEIVAMLGRHLGFDDWIGGQLEVVDGRFTGKSRIIHANEKPKELARLVEKHNASYEGSVAVGDTDRDALMLEAVEKPIAFNPNQELFELAQQRKWPIVIERKNMIYNLEPKNGKYFLA